jgi:hypothetical protein
MLMPSVNSSHEEFFDRSLSRPQALLVFGVFFASLLVCIGAAIWALNALTYEATRNDRDALIAYTVAALLMAGVALFLAWNLAKIAHQAHRILITPDEVLVEPLLSRPLRIPASTRFRSYRVGCLVVNPGFGLVPGRLVTSTKGWFCIGSKFDDYELLTKTLKSS